MRQVTLHISDKEYGHFIKLARNLHYVAKIETDEASEESVSANIMAGLEEVRLFKKGKLETTPAKDFQ